MFTDGAIGTHECIQAVRPHRVRIATIVGECDRALEGMTVALNHDLSQPFLLADELEFQPWRDDPGRLALREDMRSDAAQQRAELELRSTPR